MIPNETIFHINDVLYSIKCRRNLFTFEDNHRNKYPIENINESNTILDRRDSLFISEKLIFGKSWSRHLFYFYFKGKIKQERKTLKCDSIIFGKSMSLKNPSLSPRIRLPIGKVPLKGSTPLSPLKVSTDKVKGSVAIN